MDALNEPAVRRGLWMLAAVLTAWGLAVAAAAAAGLYQAIDPMWIGPLLVLGIIVPTVAYAVMPAFQRVIAAIGIRRLTMFHIWRIAAAMLFFWWGAAGKLPETFVRHAGWGDLIAGGLALTVILLPENRGRYAFMHLVGLADFVLALGTGLVLTRMGDPLMDGIRTLPIALIPLFGVGVTGASHLMAFDLLRHGAGAPERPSRIIMAE